uniref:Tripartite motif-containing protein 16-like n=1 Tax=Gouania willdenowi TaxID=441366 RepID=A0A8C5EUV8_GOUWI
METEEELQTETLSCSICLDLLKEPVTVPCGHSYCRTCISNHWDAEGKNHICTCPACRKEFIGRPDLGKNIMLKIQEKICSRHDEVIKMFCQTDQQCICINCFMEEHKDHEVVLAAAERTEKQRELQESRADIHKNIQDREKDVELLKEQEKTINLSADQTVEQSKQMFTELIRLLHQRNSELEKEVRSKQQTKVSAVRALKEKLEQEISELKKRDAELQQISHTEDHIQFILSYSSMSALSVSTHSSIIHRAGFLKYSQEITLDPNTAYRELRLSEGNRKVTFMEEDQHHPDHPDRFTYWSQVLSRESLTGHCYWEVEVRGIGVGVSVAYKSISRAGRGNECGFGSNDKSWTLNCSPNGYTFYHNNIKSPGPGLLSSRIGVYVDHTAGILSFYSVSETMTLLHRVNTTFTEPLHAGVYVHWYGDSAGFCKLR